MKSARKEIIYKTPKMASEKHYRKKEHSYRNSAKYNRMISLYPLLKTSISDCKTEGLVE